MKAQRVLVVDNNTSLAETVAEILSDTGFDVNVAFSGVEALVMWRKQPADLVVLDVDLPDIGGPVLARRLVRRTTQCKLVVMSARDPQGLTALCEELGAAFLAKPFSPARLMDAIQVILGREMERHESAAAASRTVRRLLAPRNPRALLQQSRQPAHKTRS